MKGENLNFRGGNKPGWTDEERGIKAENIIDLPPMKFKNIEIKFDGVIDGSGAVVFRPRKIN